MQCEAEILRVMHLEGYQEDDRKVRVRPRDGSSSLYQGWVCGGGWQMGQEDPDASSPLTHYFKMGWKVESDRGPWKEGWVEVACYTESGQRIPGGKPSGGNNLGGWVGWVRLSHVFLPLLLGALTAKEENGMLQRQYWAGRNSESGDLGMGENMWPTMSSFLWAADLLYWPIRMYIPTARRDFWKNPILPCISDAFV